MAALQAFPFDRIIAARLCNSRAGALVASLIFAVCAALAALPEAQARQAGARERAALKGVVAKFEAALRNGQVGAVVGFMPPRLLGILASQRGMSAEQLRLALPAQLKKTIEQVRFESFNISVARAEFGEAQNGTPYALLPTNAAMVHIASGQRAASTSKTLALMDGGRWYLVRIETPAHRASLRQAYPDFEQVEIPAGKMEFEKK